MSNLLLMISIVLNLLLIIHGYRLKKYIGKLIEEKSKEAHIDNSNLQDSLIKISDNMDRHFDGFAGKFHLLSNVLQTGEKGKKK